MSNDNENKDMSVSYLIVDCYFFLKYTALYKSWKKFFEQCYDRNICIYSSLVPENITNLSWKVLLLFEAGSNYRENDLFIFWKDVFV